MSDDRYWRDVELPDIDPEGDAGSNNLQVPKLRVRELTDLGVQTRLLWENRQQLEDDWGSQREGDEVDPAEQAFDELMRARETQVREYREGWEAFNAEMERQCPGWSNVYGFNPVTQYTDGVVKAFDKNASLGERIMGALQAGAVAWLAYEGLQKICPPPPQKPTVVLPDDGTQGVGKNSKIPGAPRLKSLGRPRQLYRIRQGRNASARAGVISQANEALVPLAKQFPDAQIGFRGSLARGTKGAHKGGGPFDPTDFDVDAFIVSDKLAAAIPKDRNGFRNLGRLPEHQGLIRSTSDRLRAISGHRDQTVKIRVFSADEFKKLIPDEIHLLQ